MTFVIGVARRRVQHLHAVMVGPFLKPVGSHLGAQDIGARAGVYGGVAAFRVDPHVRRHDPRPVKDAEGQDEAEPTRTPADQAAPEDTGG